MAVQLEVFPLSQSGHFREQWAAPEGDDCITAQGLAKVHTLGLKASLVSVSLVFRVTQTPQSSQKRGGTPGIHPQPVLSAVFPEL